MSVGQTSFMRASHPPQKSERGQDVCLRMLCLLWLRLWCGFECRYLGNKKASAREAFFLLHLGVGQDVLSALTSKWGG